MPTRESIIALIPLCFFLTNIHSLNEILAAQKPTTRCQFIAIKQSVIFLIFEGTLFSVRLRVKKNKEIMTNLSWKLQIWTQKVHFRKDSIQYFYAEMLCYYILIPKRATLCKTQSLMRSISIHFKTFCERLWLCLKITYIQSFLKLPGRAASEITWYTGSSTSSSKIVYSKVRGQAVKAKNINGRDKRTVFRNQRTAKN